MSATVLPPVLAPLSTSTRTPVSGRSTGTTVAGSSSGWRAATSSTSSDGSIGQPRQPRESAPRGEREVDVGEHLDGVLQLVRVVADLARELGQDARDLVALVALELAQPVGQLDDRERLDEQRLPRVAGVVDDPRHGATGTRAHGDHGTPAAFRHEIFLQMRLKIGIRRERAQAVAGASPRRREL